MKNSCKAQVIASALLVASLPGALIGTSAAGAQRDDIAFPIATHYPAFGAGEPAPKDAVVAAYGVYNNQETDYYAPTRAQVGLFVNAVRLATDGARLIVRNDFADAEESLDAVQIVNNVPIEEALYTIFLPPGWTRSGNYPVVLSGNGAGTSNNRRLYHDLELHAPIIAWRSVQERGEGLIVAISNCGGTESQGIDEATLRSVGAFFDFIAENGGDKHNAATTGGSRGGGTALVWAANPLDLDYTVRAVFAHIPPTHYGSLYGVSILTYPSMANIWEMVMGKGTSRFDHDPPPMVMPPQQLDILTGTNDIEEANARGPIGLAERLRGKQIGISEGTHDSYFPLALFLAFDRRLTELGIDHATAINLGDGHTMSFWLFSQTLAYLDALARGESYQVPFGRFYFIKTPSGQAPLEDILGAPVEDLPFTVELPARSGVGLPIDVSVCGGEGREWSVAMSGPGGDVVWEGAGIFDETECVSFRLETPAETGVYTWAFTYDGETVPPTNTPFRGPDGCGVPAVTVVGEEQPSQEEAFFRPGSVGFGIDQFSSQPEGCD